MMQYSVRPEIAAQIAEDLKKLVIPAHKSLDTLNVAAQTYLKRPSEPEWGKVLETADAVEGYFDTFVRASGWSFFPRINIETIGFNFQKLLLFEAQ